MVVVLIFFVVERLPDRIFYFQRHTQLINDKVMITASLKDITIAQDEQLLHKPA